MFNCFPDADARAQARVGPGLATPLSLRKGPRGRLVYFYVVCPHGYFEKGPRERLVCFYVVSLLVYSEKCPRGRHVCIYVLCLLVHSEKGPRERLVCLSSCSLSLRVVWPPCAL